MKDNSAANGVVSIVPAAGALMGLQTRIDAASLVSFDLFDTLFVRPFVDPEDLFDVLGEQHRIANFRTLRRAAQTEAFRRMILAGRHEIDLDGIYECFEKLPVAAELLRQAEYDLELQVTQPNAEMVPFFRYALSLGKPVIITSDTYLPVAFFERLLARNGLEPVPLFISSARNATKRDTGALFEVITLTYGLPPGDILHIGDNPIADKARAESKGLQTWLYNDLRAQKPAGPVSPAASLGRALVRLHRDEVEVGGLRELGFLKGGPAVVGLLDWIAAQAQRDRIDHILFVSRDGHPLRAIAAQRKMAGPQAGLPDFSYLLGSRVAFTLAGITEANYVAHFPFFISGAEGLSPSELLERIGVEVPADHVLNGLGLSKRSFLREDRPEPFLNFLHAWKWKVLQACRRNRRGLLQMLTSIGLRPGQRVAFVDIGWNGTTQEAFETAVHDLMPLEVFGYYFCLTDSPDCLRRREQMRMQSLVGVDKVSPQFLDAIYANRVAAEIFFSAPHGPVIGYQPGFNGVVALEDAGRADTGDIDSVSIALEAGMLSFSEHFDALRHKLGLRADPIGMAMPLLEFITGGEWARHPDLKDVKNFDSWASSRNRDLWLKDYATAGFAG